MSKSIPPVKVYSGIYGTPLRAKLMRDWARDCPFLYTDSTGVEGHTFGYRAFIIVDTEEDKDLAERIFATDKEQ